MVLTTEIVDLPNADKSTLFNALIRNDVLTANYPSAMIEPNVGVVGVPDSRLSILAKILDSQHTTPATVDFVDIADIVRGASKGEGMDDASLASIREANATYQVTRVFEDVDMTHIDGKVGPAGNISTITMKLILADLQNLEKVPPRVEKEARIKKESRPKLEAMQAAVEALESGKRIHGSGLGMELLRGLFLLTAKSFLYAFNCDQDELADEDLRDRTRQVVAPAETIFLDAKFETELVEMNEEEDRVSLEEMGIAEPGLDVLTRIGYETLGFQSYLTAGPKEARAQTIPQGATTPETVGVIHTDLQKGSIKARTISFDDLVAAGSEATVKVTGKMRLEGKDYAVRDGDVVEFRTGLTSKCQTETYLRTPERPAGLRFISGSAKIMGQIA